MSTRKALAKHPGGRPVESREGRPRKILVHIPVTEAERERLYAAATAAGLTFAKWARAKLGIT